MQDITPPRPKYKPLSNTARQPAKTTNQSTATPAPIAEQNKPAAVPAEPAKPKSTLPTLPVTAESEHVKLMGGTVKPAWYRRLLTGLFTIIFVLLLLTLNVLLWVNRSIVNGNGFVKTFGPLSDNSAIQEKVTNIVTDKILTSTPPQVLATKLLNTVPPDTPDNRLRDLLRPEVKTAITTATKNAYFGAAWRQALSTVHDTVTTHHPAGQPIHIDIKPVLNNELDSLNGTKLAFVADEYRQEVLNGKDSNYVINNPNQINTIQSVINALQRAPYLLISIILFCYAMLLILSPYRFKTTRKVIFRLSVSLLTFTLIIYLGKSIVGGFLGADTKAIVTGAMPIVLRGLVQQSLIVGTIGLVVWFILYLLHRSKFMHVS